MSAALMCEKSYPVTKPVETSNLPDVPTPLMRSKYGLRTSRQMVPRTKPLENNLKKSLFPKRSNLANPSGSHGNLRGKDLTSPRHEVKSTLTSTTGKPRKILSANFPSTVETLPLRNKMSLMKSNLTRSSLQYKSPDVILRNKADCPSTWTRHLNSKHTGARPLPTTPRVHVDCFDAEMEHKNSKDYEDIVTKSYDLKGDYRTMQTTNMGYREKCLQWLLTLPD